MHEVLPAVKPFYPGKHMLYVRLKACLPTMSFGFLLPRYERN